MSASPWRTMDAAAFRYDLTQLLTIIHGAAIEDSNAHRERTSRKRNRTLSKRYHSLIETRLSDEREAAHRIAAGAKNQHRHAYPRHGTHKRYVHRVLKCRCDPCRAANAEYLAEYRRHKKRGD